MRMIGCFCFILGVITAPSTADSSTTVPSVGSTVNHVLLHSNDSALSPMAPTLFNRTSNINDTSTDSNSTTEWKISSSTSVKPFTTKQTSVGTTGVKGTVKPTTVKKPEPKGPRSTAAPRPSPKRQSSGNMTGIIILLILIILAGVVAAVCFFMRKRERSYSIDLTSRQDDANIPLSTAGTEVPPVVVVGQNGLHNADDKEPSVTEAKELEEKPEVQEEEKTEADKPVVEASAESAAAAPSQEESEDKPPKSPAPVEQSIEDKTDDDGSISNQTSVESLKESNENNSNSVTCGPVRGMESDFVFWEVPLDCPV